MTIKNENLFAERLKTLIPAGVSQSDFAKEIGVANSTLSLWLAGGSQPKLDAIQSIAEFTDCDLNWLIAGKATSQLTADTDDFTYINRFDAHLSAGSGGMSIDGEPHVGTVGFKTNWLKQLTNTPPMGLSVANVKGDSMEPTITNGALVLVDHTFADFKSDGIYAFIMDDELYIKRVQNMMGHGLLLKSDNPTYEDQEVLDPEKVRLMLRGRILWVGNDL